MKIFLITLFLFTGCGTNAELKKRIHCNTEKMQLVNKVDSLQTELRKR